MAAGDARLELNIDGDAKGAVDALDDVQKEADETKKATDRIGDSDGLEELAGDIGRAEKELSGLVAEFNRTKRAFESAEIGKGFERAGDEAQQLRRDVVAAGRAVADFAENRPKVAGVGQAFGKVRAATKRARNELERFAKSDGPIKKLGKSITSLRAGVIGLLGAMAANVIRDFTREAVQLGKAALDVKVKLDGASLALKETLGSATAASGGLEFLESVSDRLGVAVSSMSRNFVNLTAATKGTAVAGQATEDVFEALIATSVAFGRSQQDINRALNAVAQVAGKGVAQMEELRQQLGENVPGALQALARGLKDIRPDFDGTVASLFELTAAGELTAEQALPALTIGLNELAGTAADEAMETLAGKLRVVNKTAEDARIALAEGLEPGLLKLLDAVNDNAVAISDFARGLGGLFSDVSEGLAGVVETLQDVNVGLKGFAEEFPAIFDAIGLDQFKESLLDTSAAGEAAFERIAEAAILAGQGIFEALGDSAEGASKSFDDIRQASEESFRELTKDAKLSNAARTQLAEELARNLGDIADRDLQFRKNLVERLTDAERLGHEERRNLEEQTSRTVTQLAERQIEANEKAVAAAIDGARRVEAAEAQSTARRRENFEAQVVLAEDAARKRVSAESEAAEGIAKIDESLTAKRKKLLEEFVAAAELEAGKRKDVEEEVLRKLGEIETAAARKREDEIASRLEKEKAASKERIALAEKEKAALIAIGDAVRAAAAGPEDRAMPDQPQGDGGGGIAQQSQDVDTLKKSVAELIAELGELRQAGIETGLDPAKILAASQALTDAVAPLQGFGRAATTSAQEFSSAQDEINRRALDTIAVLDEQLQKAIETGAINVETAKAFTEALSAQTAALQAEAEAGIATDEGILKLTETFAAFTGETAPAVVEAHLSIQNQLAELTTATAAQDEATAKSTEATKAQVVVVEDLEGQVTILGKAKETLKAAEFAAATAARETTKATEAEAEAAEKAAIPTSDLAESLSKIAEESAPAATGVEATADAAGDLAAVDPPDGIAAGLAAVATAAPGAAGGLDAATGAAQSLADTAAGVSALAAAVAGLATQASNAAQQLNGAADAASRLQENADQVNF